MKIDVHSHFLSKAMAETLERHSTYPYTRLVDGTYHFHCCDGLTIPMVPPLCDMNVKLNQMDEASIDVSVLSLAVPGPELLGGSQADAMAIITNDLLAEFTGLHSDRFWAYATLGFGNMDNALKELDRCMNSLGFHGLQLFSNINGKPLDSDEFRPIFKFMADIKKPIFIHPTVPLNQKYLMDLIPVPVFAFLVDTTIAAMRLALSGALSVESAAPIIIPHVGATLPYLAGRLDSMSRYFGQDGLEVEPSRYLKRLYMDTVAYEKAPLEWCLSFIGIDHMLLGTDHPYGDWKRPLELLESISLYSEEEKNQIYHTNAERLFT